MDKPTVKLNDGTEVALEEFIKWTPRRQAFKTLPLEELHASRIRRGMAHRRAVNTPLGRFETMGEAVKALGITKDALRKLLLNTAYPKYSFVNPTQKELSEQFHKVYKVGPKKTVTPIGIFKSKIAAANALGILKDQLGKLMLTNPSEYYYAEDNVNQSNFKR
jgi:hypothetical protein